MARITRQEDSFDGKRSAEDLLEILLSATNPDGTPFSLPIEEGKPPAADVLVGHLAHTATTVAATLLTIPAGRTWKGEICIQSAIAVNAAVATAGFARGEVATADADVVPAAGVIASCEARCGQNAATGTVGTQDSASITVPAIVIATGVAAVRLTLATNMAGSNGRVAAMAIGRLL